MSKKKLACLAAAFVAGVLVLCLVLSLFSVLPGLKALPKEGNVVYQAAQVQEVTPEVTPEVTETPTPTPTPEITPELTPEITPEITPELTPEITEAPEEEEIPFIVQISKKKYLHVREAGDKKSKSIGKLKKNDYGIVLEVGETYSYIQWGTIRGYVANECIVMGEEAQALIDALNQ